MQIRQAARLSLLLFDIGEEFVTSVLHGSQAEIHADVTIFGSKCLGCERSLATRRPEILARRRIKLILFVLAVFRYSSV